MIVSFHDWTKGTTLGATKIALPGNGNGEVDGNFTKIDFNLSTDDAGAGCTDVISCSGEFRVMVSGPGAVSFDFVFLQPGTWGRFKGLSVLKSGADLLATMGVGRPQSLKAVSSLRVCHVAAVSCHAGFALWVAT